MGEGADNVHPRVRRLVGTTMRRMWILLERLGNPHHRTFS